jgi:hypothetical protein
MHSATRVVAVPPNKALQRSAIGIKCSAAGVLASRAPQRWRARVLQCRRAVAELSSYAAFLQSISKHDAKKCSKNRRTSIRNDNSAQRTKKVAISPVALDVPTQHFQEAQ